MTVAAVFGELRLELDYAGGELDDLGLQSSNSPLLQFDMNPNRSGQRIPTPPAKHLESFP